MLPIPDFTCLKPPGEVEAVIKQMQKAKKDTRELEAANKQFQSASTKLVVIMKECYQVASLEHGIMPELYKNPAAPSPIPIPYPIIAKSRKATDRKIGELKKAEEKHKKATDKVKKILDKQTSDYKRTSGDQPGIQKDITSISTAKESFITMSSQVKVEGARFQKLIGTNRKIADKKIKTIEKKQKKKK
jgi:hypothetical protein